MRRLDPSEPGWAAVIGIVRGALAEDIGPGDITSSVSIPAEAVAEGSMLAKQDGVLAGIEVASECLRQLDAQVRWQATLKDGEAFRCGQVLATAHGSARALLAAERTALNFVQRLSGVATLAREFARRTEGTQATIVDTRKTTPGLRALEKAAVLAGGGSNHRHALYDGILLKDNHIAVAGGIRRAVQQARSLSPHTFAIEVETTDLVEVAEALTAGADVIMLDNMDCATMREAVALIAGRAVTEASGNVSLDSVHDIALTGVDLISVGRLTHSAPAIDISLKMHIC